MTLSVKLSDDRVYMRVCAFSVKVQASQRQLSLKKSAHHLVDLKVTLLLNLKGILKMTL